MNNPYVNYYSQQAQIGGALKGFSGVRFQRGHGFFGRLFSGVGNFIKGLLPTIGQTALPSAVELANDLMTGQNFKTSAKRRLKEAGQNVASATLDRIKNKIQTGQGIRQRKIRRDKKLIFKYLKSFRKKKRKSKRKTIKRRRKTKKK